jgi:hypothetical protein
LFSLAGLTLLVTVPLVILTLQVVGTSIKKVGHHNYRAPLSAKVNQTVRKLELILVKTLPIIGPRISKTAITTTATKTRINAYSTKPWAFSSMVNNMVSTSFPLVDFSEDYSELVNVLLLSLILVDLRFKSHYTPKRFGNHAISGDLTVL